MNIQKILKERILILDGGMGTEILKRLERNVDCLEMLNLDNRYLITAIHKEFIQAGADILTTNTFGANRIKLAHYGLESRVKAINAAAVAAAVEARGGRSVYIAGSLGPVGQLIKPLGPLDEEDVYQAYAEQAQSLEKAGADLLFIETQIDILEAKIALNACKENSRLPVSLSVSYPMDGGRTVTGSDPETAAVTFSSSQADIFGINCGDFPQDFEKHLTKILLHSTKPLIVYANAGSPEKKGNSVAYSMSPKEYLSLVRTFVKMGASIVGGCCGTTPEFIALMAKQFKGKKPRPKKKIDAFFRASSRNAVLTIGSPLPFRVFGENINPFGRKKLSRELESENLDLVREFARKQEKAGADALDINLGRKGETHPAFFAHTVRELQTLTRLPLVLDNMNPESLEKALRFYAGKAIINSINGVPKNYELLFPLAKKYGASVVLLAMDERGIPDRARGRFRIIEKLHKKAREHGLTEADILADPVVLTISVAPQSAQETLQAIEKIKSLGIATICGLSNLSFGLPARSLLNATFLPMAAAYGLDSAILNPLDEKLMEAVKSCGALLDRKEGMRLFLDTFRKKPQIDPNSAPKKEVGSPQKELFQAILEGEKASAARLTQRLLAEGRGGLEILEKILSPALKTAGEYYENKTYFLPQLVLSAEAMERASHVLEKHLDIEGKSEKKLKIVMATVHGDLHDIGKNIVSLVLRNYGYEVWDLGKNIPVEIIVDAAVQKKADFVGLSALMTTTMDEMEKVVERIKTTAPHIKVIVGGAAVSPSFARKIGADAYGKNALDGIRKIEKLAGLDQ